MRILFFIFILFSFLSSAQEIDLSGEWEYKVGNSGSWKSCELPNTISSILGTAPPVEYVRFRKKIDIPLELLDKKSVRLAIDHVDTYCSVLVNDDKMGDLENFFIGADIEIKDNLLPGENEIILEFTPAKWVFEKMWKKAGVSFSPARQRLDIEMHERKPRYMHRNSPDSDFGIYGGIKIKAYDHIEIRDVNFKLLSESDGRAKILIKVHADVMESGAFKFESKYFTQEEKILTGSDRDIIWTFFIDDFKYWYPKGMGDQNSFKDKMTISFRRLNDREYTKDTEVDYRINFHKIELIQNPKVEEEFSFEMEGMEVTFNATLFKNQYIADPKKQKEFYHSFLEKVVQTDVNLINVHGSGGYPENEFYEICDSLGIMVWQDFAFSGIGYPSDSVLYKNARKEVNHQMRRISEYACLLLFSGSAHIDKYFADEVMLQKYGVEKKEIKTLKKGQNDLFGRILRIALNKFNSRLYYKAHSPDFESGKTDYNFGSFTKIDP